jgi:hypothetical protein
MEPEELQEIYLDLLNQKSKLDEKISNINEQLYDVHLEGKDSFLNQLTVYDIEPRKTIQWKKIAEVYNPPEDVIETFSSLSKPSFGIRLRKQEDN